MNKFLKHSLLFFALLCSVSAQGAATPFEVTDNMMPGWNLGNALDALGGETNWGNPKTTQAMVDAVAKAGFRSIRVPVSWDDYVSGSNYTISTAWMNRVEEVVNYALKNNLYVILNVHHTQNGWLDTTYARQASAQDRLGKYWQQIAARFRNYGDKLVFETMNEPRNGNDWWGTAETFAVINSLNKTALATIRASGGNNARRLVMLPTYAASAYDHQLDGFSLPADPMIAVSVHGYLPYAFAMEVPGTSSFSDTAVLDALFARIQTRYVAKGIPVVMGEWASTHKNNLAERIRHAEYYVKAAAKARVPALLWDNNVFTTQSGAVDVMGQLNRATLSWTYPELITSIMRGATTWKWGGASSSSSSAASSSAASAAASSSVASSSAAASSASSASSAAAASSSAAASSASSASSVASSSAASVGVSASYVINNDWGGGYCASVTVRNDTASTLVWKASLTVVGKVNQMWNASWQQSGSALIFSGTGWSRSLAPGASVGSMGFCATR